MSQRPLTAAVHCLRQTAVLAERSDVELLRDYIGQHDPEAFTTLVRRYHGLVLAVCRRVLGHEQDAEDACQAVFLVLAQSAATVRHGEALVGWLYGTAYRIARKANRTAARRRAREERHSKTPVSDPVAELTWREVRTAVHEEVERLPGAARSAFVLCCLEGLSHAEAARRLGLAEGSISSQVSRARQRLHQRLARRGIDLSSVLAVCSISRVAHSARAGEHLVRQALAFAAGERAGISGHVLALSRAGGPAVWAAPDRWMAALILLGILGLGVKLVQEANGQPASTGEPAQLSSPATRPGAGAQPDRDTTLVHGRVVDADGKPARRVKLFISDNRRMPPRPAPQSATDEAGRFRFRLGPAADLTSPRTILATAPKTGTAWWHCTSTYRGEEVVLRLSREVPVSGRVTDLEGRPVSGAAIRVHSLAAVSDGKLDEVLKLWREEKGNRNRADYLLRHRLLDHTATERPPAATTDRSGRFTLAGLGSEQVAMVLVSGPGVASELVRVVLRPGFRLERTARDEPLYGPTLSLALGPAKPITGVVRDAQTGNPIAGVRIVGQTADRAPSATATSDRDGRFQLDGLPKRSRYRLIVQPGSTHPYLPREQEVADTPGADAIGAVVALHRGVVVTGRVVNRQTGEPVQAAITYAPLASTSDLLRRLDYVDRPVWEYTDARGNYRVVVVPGPGVLLVQTMRQDAGRFPRALLDPGDHDPEIFDKRFQVFRTAVGSMYPLNILTTYRILRPKAKVRQLTCDITLTPGKSRSGIFLDQDDKPVAGVTAYGLWNAEGQALRFRAATFIAEGLNPADPCPVLFWQQERKLSALVPLRGDEKEPVRIVLQPTAVITGRLLDAAGKPIAAATLAPSYQDNTSFVPALNSQAGFYDRPIHSDRAGRFRLDNIPAGLRLYVIARPLEGRSHYSATLFTLKAGETRDLGDWKLP